MNRRDFLMRIGSGMIGALVVRPSQITQFWNPHPKQIEFIIGVDWGFKFRDFYYLHPRRLGVITHIEDPFEDKK